MGVPNVFRVRYDPVDASHNWSVSGVHAFLYTMFRHHKGQTLDADKLTWRYEYNSLSQIYLAFLAWADDLHSHRLQRMEWSANRAQMFNEKIVAKITALSAVYNVPVPAALAHISYFSDGNRLRVSRIGGEYWRQAAIFSGDKWIHNCPSLGTIGPDGIFYQWFDGPLGKQNDKHLMRHSGLNLIMRNMQQGRPWQYWSYTDKGFNRNTHIFCAHHGPGIYL